MDAGSEGEDEKRVKSHLLASRWTMPATEIRNGQVEVDQQQIDSISQRLRLKSLQSSSGDVRKAAELGAWGSKERLEAWAYRPWLQPGGELISLGDGREHWPLGHTQRDSQQVGNVIEYYEEGGKTKSE